MKSILMAVTLLLSIEVIAQDFTPYQSYQIRKGIKLEILDIKRVEQYGWDNLEIKYKLKNETGFEIHKLDFQIHLLGKHHAELGTVEAHVFSVPKHSEEVRTYVDAKTDFGSTKINKYIGEVIQMDVYVDEDSLRLASIKTVSEIKE